MKKRDEQSISRRNFIKTSSTALASLSLFSIGGACQQTKKISLPLKRSLGKLNHEATTLGLGGQASIQWTAQDVDPVKIILKSFDLGINYFDTSNLYGPSQLNYHKAFKEMNLIVGNPGYDQKLRESIFLTSKTHIRWSKGGLDLPGINNWTNGQQGSYTLDDVRRSLSIIFGDGKGNYPQGAYLDMVLLHSITSQADVDAVYYGLNQPDPKQDKIGALAALKDIRDGTNLTGLNPKEEKLIRHIGFSGHYHPGIMMQLIQKDEQNLLEGLLVAINSNDKLNFNMQNNVIPVAKTKNMGLIGMKTFADGAMYTKKADWSRTPQDVVRTVGSDQLPFAPLIQYSLTTPGIQTLIVGIGQISNDQSKCQLYQNFISAQVHPEDLNENERKEIEKLTQSVKKGKTNYFQMEQGGLSSVNNLKLKKLKKMDKPVVQLIWDTAYAGSDPVKEYEIFKNKQKVATITHQPQTSLNQPFIYVDKFDMQNRAEYAVVTVDQSGKKIKSESIYS